MCPGGVNFIVHSYMKQRKSVWGKKRLIKTGLETSGFLRGYAPLFKV